MKKINFLDWKIWFFVPFWRASNTIFDNRDPDLEIPAPNIDTRNSWNRIRIPGKGATQEAFLFFFLGSKIISRYAIATECPAFLDGFRMMMMMMMDDDEWWWMMYQRVKLSTQRTVVGIESIGVDAKFPLVTKFLKNLKKIFQIFFQKKHQKFSKISPTLQLMLLRRSKDVQTFRWILLNC